jgi:hypothetical protein
VARVGPMTADDYAALEARVSELELQMRHILPSKIDALAYGLSLVHEDVRAIRETVEGHDGRFDAVDRSLAEILSRLPAE